MNLCGLYALRYHIPQEKIRKRIHIHGTNRESLISIIGRKGLFKKYGGEVEHPNEPFGDMLWHTFLAFEDIFEGNYDEAREILPRFSSIG